VPLTDFSSSFDEPGAEYRRARDEDDVGRRQRPALGGGA
jgi:hypothetical protein